MNVLIITPHYINRVSGGSLGSRAYIGAFTSIYENCTLIYPDDNGINISNYFPPNLKLLPCYDNRTKIQKGIDLYLGILTRFPKFIKEHLKRNNYDIIVFDHLLSTIGIINIINKQKTKIITIHHNVEIDYYKDNLPPIYLRYAILPRINKSECQAIKKSDLNLTVTLQDRESFITRMKADPSKIFYWGISESYSDISISLIPENKTEHKEPIFIITGSLCFPQSIESITKFIHLYYPLIKQEFSNFKLLICGRDPNKKLIEAIKELHNIEIIANPINIINIIKKADIYICPIESGGGIKLRIMDGLKCGIPVIAHKNSCRGYENFTKHHYILSYDDQISFIRSLRNIKEKYPNKEAIQTYYYSCFSFQSEIERLKIILKKQGLYDNQK